MSDKILPEISIEKYRYFRIKVYIQKKIAYNEGENEFFDIFLKNSLKVTITKVENAYF